MNESHFQRFKRQILLPDFGASGQEKLIHSRVLVIGAGGLGSPVLLYLAAAGVGTLGLVDYDLVELSNLQRQILYDTRDLQQPKVLQASKKLHDLNPDLTIEPHFFRLTKDNILPLVSGYDVIVEGTDNFYTKFLVNDACVLAGKPFILGAVFQFEGQLSVFNYQGGPGYRCLNPEMPSPGEYPSCAEGGVLGPVPGIIGSLMALETIKVLTGSSQTLSGRLLQFNGLNNQFQYFEIERIDTNFSHESLDHFPDEEEWKCQSQTGLPQISTKALQTMVLEGKPLQIIDISDDPCQLPFEAIYLHLSNAIPDNRLAGLQKELPTVVACQYGIKSPSFGRWLKEKHGFHLVYNLENGIQGLLQFPTE